MRFGFSLAFGYGYRFWLPPEWIGVFVVFIVIVYLVKWIRNKW